MPMGESNPNRGIARGGNSVYDVLFLDRSHGEKVLASGLDHDSACEVARAESQRLGVGRMFLAGSELGPVGEMIVIVESAFRAA
jgi:hypothetical protein